MARPISGYVEGMNRAKYEYMQIAHADWSASQQNQWELSVLPMGMYCIGFDFVVEVRLSQDGNADDGIDRTDIVNLIESISIEGPFGQHVQNLTGMQLMQAYKIETGHTPPMPADVAASSGASTVYTNTKFVIPFRYSQFLMERPQDFAFPTTLLQDHNLRMRWGVDLSALHASNAVEDADFYAYAILANYNRATIPPKPVLGVLTSTSSTFQLPPGNYQYVFATAFAKADLLAMGNIRADADGDMVVDNCRIDHFQDQMILQRAFCADNFQVWVDVLDNGSYPDVNDKDTPPQPSADYLAAGNDTWMAGLYYGYGPEKIADLLRVENRFNFTITGTNHDKHIVYRMYRNHSASEVEQNAKMMGFAPGSAMGNRSNTRSLTPADMHLRNLLPIRLKRSE